MNRRDALNRVALILGGTVVGGAAFLEGCKSDAKMAVGLPFSPENIAFLDEVAETIIPTTTTPGAKAAGVGAFMNTMVVDCYEESDQKIFIEGLSKIDGASNKKNGKSFMESTPQQRTALLTEIDQELKEYNKTKKSGDPKNNIPADPNHYFGMMKQLTLLGYFSSEIGATKALRYEAVPGRYEGCIPYKKGDKAWAT